MIFVVIVDCYCSCYCHYDCWSLLFHSDTASFSTACRFEQPQAATTTATSRKKSQAQQRQQHGEQPPQQQQQQQQQQLTTNISEFVWQVSPVTRTDLELVDFLRAATAFVLAVVVVVVVVGVVVVVLLLLLLLLSFCTACNQALLSSWPLFL